FHYCRNLGRGGSSDWRDCAVRPPPGMGALPWRRAMRGSGSPGSRQLLPRSLMQRLTLLADGQLTPVASAGAEQRWRQRHRLSPLVFFGVGALTSSMLGGLTLLGLRALNAAEAVAAVPPATSAPEVVDVAIERGERERSALGVRVEGAEGAD